MREAIRRSLALWWLWLMLGVVGANLFGVQAHGDTYYLDIGARGDLPFVGEMHGHEIDALGESYRWTSAQSELHIPGIAAPSRAQVTFDLGGLPAEALAPRMVSVQLDDRAWLDLPADMEPRRYHLLLDPAALGDGDVRFSFVSATSQSPSDLRAVGVRLDAVILSWATDGWQQLAWQYVLVQAALILAVIGIAWRIGVPARWRVALGLGMLALLAGMVWFDPFIAVVWQRSVLGFSVLGLLIAWNAAALIQRGLPPDTSRHEIGILGGVAIVVTGVHLLGALYPAFVSHDLYIHSGRLLKVQFGSLHLFDRPAEFAGRIIAVPPAFYVLASPLTLLMDAGSAIQGFYALLSALSALLVAILVRQVGGSLRAAVAAALIIAFLPIQFTALWWGFAPQVVGQSLMLLLLVVINARTLQHNALTAGGAAPVQDAPITANNCVRYSGALYWATAGVILCLALLIHNGVAILGGFWLVGYIIMLWRFRWRTPDDWRVWVVVVVGSGLVALLVFYLDAAVASVRELFTQTPTSVTTDEALRLRLIGSGLESSLRPIGIPLTLLSLAAALFHTRGEQRWLFGAWLASAGAFLAVDLVFGLQVRYAYFAMPLVSAGLALLLDRLMNGRAWGWLVSALVVGVVVVAGVNVWYSGVFWAVKPTLTALTH